MTTHPKDLYLRPWHRAGDDPAARKATVARHHGKVHAGGALVARHGTRWSAHVWIDNGVVQARIGSQGWATRKDAQRYAAEALRLLGVAERGGQ